MRLRAPDGERVAQREQRGGRSARARPRGRPPAVGLRRPRGVPDSAAVDRERAQAGERVSRACQPIVGSRLADQSDVAVSELDQKPAECVAWRARPRERWALRRAQRAVDDHRAAHVLVAGVRKNTRPSTSVCRAVRSARATARLGRTRADQAGCGRRVRRRASSSRLAPRRGPRRRSFGSLHGRDRAPGSRPGEVELVSCGQHALTGRAGHAIGGLLNVLETVQTDAAALATSRRVVRRAVPSPCAPLVQPFSTRVPTDGTNSSEESLMPRLNLPPQMVVNSRMLYYVGPRGPCRRAGARPAAARGRGERTMFHQPVRGRLPADQTSGFEPYPDVRG